MGRPDLQEIFQELAAVPPPPSRLDSAALYAAGRSRRRTFAALVTSTAAAVLAMILAGGIGILHNGRDATQVQPGGDLSPGVGYASPMPSLDAQPGAACRERVSQATDELARGLPAAWIPGYTSDCVRVYVRLTVAYPHEILWLVLMTIPDGPRSAAPCTEARCRQTDVGPLTWGTGTGGLYAAPPGQIGTGLAWANVERIADGMRLSLFEWLTYVPSADPPQRPHTPAALGDALLAAARRL
jgi:hypothetical protein